MNRAIWKRKRRSPNLTGSRGNRSVLITKEKKTTCEKCNKTCARDQAIHFVHGFCCEILPKRNHRKTNKNIYICFSSLTLILSHTVVGSRVFHNVFKRYLSTEKIKTPLTNVVASETSAIDNFPTDLYKSKRFENLRC